MPVDGKPIRVMLYEPDGNLHPWHIIFAPIKPSVDGGKKFTTYGNTDWEKRVITVNSRIKGTRDIFRTLLHEAGVHVTCGQVGSEWLAEAIEANVDEAFRVIERSK